MAATIMGRKTGANPQNPFLSRALGPRARFEPLTTDFTDFTDTRNPCCPCDPWLNPLLVPVTPGCEISGLGRLPSCFSWSSKLLATDQSGQESYAACRRIS